MNNQQLVSIISKGIVALCTWMAAKYGFTFDGHGVALTVAPILAGLLATWWAHWVHSSPEGPSEGKDKSGVIGSLMIAGLAAFVFTGCAHVHDGSRTYHRIHSYGALVPPGWTVVKPNVTNTAAGNEFADFTVTAPSGTNTNAPGFFTSLVSRPRVFLAYREEWEDASSGGGTFVLTDPQASQLTFARTNQSGLGGSRSVSVGNIQSTITTNAVSAIGAAGTAVGNVVGQALKR